MRSFITTATEFMSYNNNILFERVKLVSYMLIFSYPCFFIVDFFLFKNLSNPTFKFILSAVHITGLVISLIFIGIYHLSKNISESFIIHCYILLYLMIGAVTSINSQLFTGNIYAYIIILMGVAVIFPVRPRTFSFLVSGVHLFFLIGLFLMDHDHFSFLSKMINSTGTAVISCTISLSFYTSRKNDFINKLKLRRNEESFRSLFNMNPNPLILIKPNNNKILLMNRHAVEYYHLQNKDLAQMDAGFLFKDLQERLDIIKRLKKQESIRNYVTEQQITPEMSKWTMLSFEYVDYLDDTCILIGATDITDFKKNEEELYKHASIDILTGVMNRRSGMELLREKLSSSSSSQEFIICYIDINNLKMVNDCYGHSIGDDLIKTCCETISRHLTPNDVLFRLGGDEFVIIFHKKQMQVAQQLWNNIKREFQDINDTNQKPYPISASHGFYHYKTGSDMTVEQLLEMADKEMYKEKFLQKTARYQ